MLNEFGTIENFPPKLLGKHQANALLFKRLATLRTDAKLFKKTDDMKWRGPTKYFEKFAEKISDPKLIDRANKLFERI